MPVVGEVLFVQGGGAGAHDDWDARMVDSLARALGDGYEVHFPRMPNEKDPSYGQWGATIQQELLRLNDGAVVVGHSVGGTILVKCLVEAPVQRRLDAIVLVAAPFVGAGGWPGDGFELTRDVAARLPSGVPVHVFHGLDDQTAPPDHADLYKRAVPQAQLHLLPGRDHQLNDDLSEVANVVCSELGTVAHSPG